MRSYTSSRRPFILIAFIIATIYVVARRRIRVLASQPVICGLAYGVIAYLVMNYAVLPLSNARPGGPFVLPVFINEEDPGTPSRCCLREAAVGEARALILWRV